MKRLLDVVLVLVTFPLWGTVVLLTAVVSALVQGLPVFFVQERAGLGGRSFRLVKFRSMRAGEGDDAARLTRFGRFLRASSLDELPELLNVLRGDMSLVGPRPLPVRYLPRYTPEQRRRHEVRPGVTGWAQVNGRNSLDWETKFRYDVEYVGRQSLAFDFRILFMTFFQVLFPRHISHEGEATMGEFFGIIPQNADSQDQSCPTCGGASEERNSEVL